MSRCTFADRIDEDQTCTERSTIFGLTLYDTLRIIRRMNFYPPPHALIWILLLTEVFKLFILRSVMGKPFSKQALFFFTCLQYNSFENTAGRGEIARNEQFLLFPQCFIPVSKIFFHFHKI